MSINKKVILVLFFCTSFILQACVSAPPDVHASIPLINKQAVQEGEYLAEELQSVISKTEIGGVLSSGHRKIILGHSYVSAMGLSCKEVVVTDSTAMNYETSVCKSKQGWFLVPDLMDKQTSEYIEG
jgi:hypothetical protein